MKNKKIVYGEAYVMRTFFIIVFSLLIFFLAMFFIVKFVIVPAISNADANESTNSNNQNNDNDNDDKDSDNFDLNLPSIVLDANLKLEILNTGHKFEYSIQNIGLHSETVTIKDTSIATINEQNFINPLTVGTTKIIVSINTSPAIIAETTLTIVDSVTDVTFNILNLDEQNVDKCFANCEYVLEIIENKSTNNSYQVNYSEHISKFQLFSRINGVIKFAFIADTNNTIEFEYKTIYFSKKQQYNMLNLTNSFSVTFNNNITNENINYLYLFDDDKTNEANNDGYYNQTTFNYKIDLNSYDEFNIKSYDNTAFTITENTISAKKVGIFEIVFETKYSGKTYTAKFNISQIDILYLTINNLRKELNGTQTIELETNINSLLNVSYYPIYALCSLTYFISNEDILIYHNNYVKLTESTNCSLIIKNNNTNIYQINFTPKPIYYFNLTLTQQYNCEAELIDNNITINYGENAFIQLINKLYLNGILFENQTTTFSFDNQGVCAINDSIINGVINIQIISKGTTNLTLTNVSTTEQIIVKISVE